MKTLDYCVIIYYNNNSTLRNGDRFSGDLNTNDIAVQHYNMAKKPPWKINFKVHQFRMKEKPFAPNYEGDFHQTLMMRMITQRMGQARE